LSATVRAQASIGDAVFGASQMSSPTYDPTAPAERLRFSAVDARWMRSGVQLKAELMVGRLTAGTLTKGYSIDASVHRRFMGPVTAVLRTERLTFESDRPFTWMDMLCPVGEPWLATRYAAGARVRLPGGLLAQASMVRQGHEMAEFGKSRLFDFALTYSVRR
jgi:hypothetical protein